jgi:hypothetical protein
MQFVLTTNTDSFDEEVRRALHQRLTLNQIPYHSFLASRAKNTKETNQTFRNALLSSALYRTTTSSEAKHHPIKNRIRNCILVAQHVSSNHNIALERELYKKFCDAASTSRCCWNYTFSLRHHVNVFVHHVDEYGISLKASDLRLETALLVANGYQLAEVKHWLIRLGRLGMLVGYRTYAIRGFSAVTAWERTEDVCSLAVDIDIDDEEIEAAMMEERKISEQELDEDFDELERGIRERLL